MRKITDGKYFAVKTNPNILHLDEIQSENKGKFFLIIWPKAKSRKRIS